MIVLMLSTPFMGDNDDGNDRDNDRDEDGGERESYANHVQTIADMYDDRDVESGKSLETTFIWKLVLLSRN